MSLQSLLKRLSYRHKRTALQYFLDDPRLIFGIPAKPTKTHVGNFIERATDENIVAALHNFLPRKFLDHVKEVGGLDRQGYRLMIYMLIKKYQPNIMVETGVARGTSSAYSLQAMEENGNGKLYSIDLPAKVAEVNADAASEQVSSKTYELADGQVHGDYDVGYLVPEWLRTHWELILEDSRVALPKLLKELVEIDVFYHDSLHSYEHMKFEFETAWPFIKPGGLLLSDDVLWNNAFHEFCKKQNKKPFIYRSFGMIQK